MRFRYFTRQFGAVVLSLFSVLIPLTVVAQDSSESMLEASRSRDAELDPVLTGDIPVTLLPTDLYPLFVGFDAASSNSAFLVDPDTNANTPIFGGVQVWGSAYDPQNDKVFFSGGSVLYEWPVGSATATELGIITNAGGSPQSIVGLAFHSGVLYGTIQVGAEAVWQIDTTTLVTSMFIDFADEEYSFGGFSADPNTGEFYGTNDDSTPHGRGLYRINLDGTTTLITPYPAGEEDIDGLAISNDGIAYLVEDQGGDSIHVYDFASGSYLDPLTSPFTTTGSWSGGAWLGPGGPGISLNKTVGTVPATCATTDAITTASVNTDVYYCYEVTNTGAVTLEYHTLVDDQLGALLLDLPQTLVPGDSYQHIEMANVTAPVVNNATWTATNGPMDYVADDTIAYNFEDISATGTVLPLGDDDIQQIPLGFFFKFYGEGQSDFWVSSNGFLSAANQGHGCCSGQAIPDLDTPNGVIGGWWQDLNPDSGGTVYYETLGAHPNRYAVVQFDAVNHFFNGNPVTMEYKLFEDGTIEVHYQDAPPDGDGTGIHTAGVENATGTSATLYYHGAGPLSTPIAVRYTPSEAAHSSDSDTAWVYFGDPDIDVSPLSLEAVLNNGTSTVQEIGIGNLGEGLLDWSIVEDDTRGAGSRYPPFGAIGSGDSGVAADTLETPSVKEQDIPWAAVAPLWKTPTSALYNNGPFVNSPGTGVGGDDESMLQNSSLAMDQLGFGHQVSAGNRIADDFQVTDPLGWTIDNITFFAYQTDSTTTSTITGVNLRIWDGPPDDPGSAVVWGDDTTNVMIATSFSSTYRVSETTPGNANRPVMANKVAVGTTLAQGTYWLDWQTDGVLASGPFAPPITINGSTTTGNGLQFTGSWAPAIDEGTSGTESWQQGFPFIIQGMGSPACQEFAEIPWLTAVPTAGSTLPGTTDSVAVTIDSTGYDFGVYEANLCVYSNDPDLGPGNGTRLVVVPVTMEVVIPVELQSFSIE